MNKLRNALISLPVALLLLGGFAAPVYATNCSVQVGGTTNDANAASSRFHISADGTTASTTVTVSGTCTLTLASWEAPNGTFDQHNVDTQKLHSHTTETLSAGTHTISVAMANCFYQLDLVMGSSATAPDGSPNYGAGGVTLLAWAQGGSKVCEQPKPKLSCDLLELAKGDNRTVTISKLDTTAENGATFTNAVVNWGDNTTPLTSDKAVGQTHQYANDGTYTVTAVAHFGVNGQDQTASSATCVQTVSFSTPTPPTPPTPPQTPPQLVNTGPGAVVGLSALTAIAGAIGYNLLARRFARR